MPRSIVFLGSIVSRELPPRTPLTVVAFFSHDFDISALLTMYHFCPCSPNPPILHSLTPLIQPGILARYLLRGHFRFSPPIFSPDELSFRHQDTLRSPTPVVPIRVGQRTACAPSVLRFLVPNPVLTLNPPHLAYATQLTSLLSLPE